ncbi:two-component system OmpR family sensor kinase [Phytomonospora endophytica]|uniref:histidine kinase n=1 Tax=Phytomonospora endophytica TaxID=714109 RepID=A0A841FIP6_9ACTN|nr:two-component system OmpR family sensor kinase [Phytomonospora endophytica]
MLSRPVSTVRGGWQRTPLRVKLMAAVLLLVAIALILISVVSVTRLDSYLQDRVDSELTERVNTGLIKVNLTTSDIEGLPTDYSLILMRSQSVADRFNDGKYERDELPYTKDNPDPQIILSSLQARLGMPPYTVTAADGKTRWRVVSREVIEAGTGRTYLAAIGVDLTDADSIVAQLTTINLLVGGGVLAAVAAIGIGMVRASLQPLRQMEATAAAIAAGDLSRRVPQHDIGTEVGQLGAALNTMLSQIETAFAASAASEAQALRSEERMRRFVADASHELRTPLTTVRGFAELYRQRGEAAPAEEVAASMRRIEEEAKRMGLLVEDLLLLARLDRERPVQLEPVDMLGLAVDAVSGAKVTVPDRPLELKVGKGPLMVLGDELRLRQVLSNLLDNAIAHTPPETPIEVRVYAEAPYVFLEVADSGPGMTPEQAERVFERFYRADPARGRKAGGSGLGLAIVAALVAAHNGLITVDTDLGVGTVFRVRLEIDPAVLEDDEPDDSEDTDADAPESDAGDAGKAPLSANSQDRSSDT